MVPLVKTKRRPFPEDRDPKKERTFLLLYYRQELGSLIQRLELQEDSKEVFKRKHKKYPYSKYDVSLRDVAERLQYVVRTAQDLDKCHDICKSMYFCDLPRGHKGKHLDETRMLGW